MVDAGDLRLDPYDRSVRITGKYSVQLTKGLRWPAALGQVGARQRHDIDLYMAFLERRAYHHNDEPELTMRSVVKNYISRLRGDLSPPWGPESFVCATRVMFTAPRIGSDKVYLKLM